MKKYQKWLIWGSIALLLIATIILLCFFWKDIFNENVAVLTVVVVAVVFVSLGTFIFYRIQKK